MRIEATVQNAIADLILLNALPAIQYSDREGYEGLLLSTLPVLSRDQILEIRRVNRDDNTLFVASDQGISMEHIGVRPQEAGVYLSWASTVSNRGKTMATGVRPRDPGKDRRHLVIDLIIPTYEDATDGRHPHASLAREESRGAHARRDFPTRDDDGWLRHTLCVREQGALRLDYKPVTFDTWRPVERKY